MCPGMRPATGWIANLTSTPRFSSASLQLADPVLRLRRRHPVAGHDHDTSGGVEQERRLLGVDPSHGPPLGRRCQRHASARSRRTGRS